MTQFALLGSAALWLMYVWLLAAIIASYLSERKGYGEKLGLAFGLLLSLVGTIIWLVWPPKARLQVEEDRPLGSRQGHGGAARRGRGGRPSRQRLVS